LAARTGVHVHQPGAVSNWWQWMLMVAAMILPLQIDGVRRIAEYSLWSRRHRAIAGYLVGYLIVWAAAGVPSPGPSRPSKSPIGSTGGGRQSGTSLPQPG
jgi:hypothetical protein